VFVGGLSGETSEAEMKELFSSYGEVTSIKIIQDRAGVSKGYGFVTFENEEQARNLLRHTEVYLKSRKLNIAPAIKKVLLTLYGTQIVCFCLSEKYFCIILMGGYSASRLKKT